MPEYIVTSHWIAERKLKNKFSYQDQKGMVYILWPGNSPQRAFSTVVIGRY